MPKPAISDLKNEISLLLYVVILIALGVLGAATTADFVLAKTAKVQTAASPGVKIADSLAAQSK
jgi:hypothetical protein